MSGPNTFFDDNVLERQDSIPWQNQTSIVRSPEERDPGELPALPTAMEEGEEEEPKEVVAVFNANTQDGSRVVRAFSKVGSSVIAIVRVFTSRKSKALMKLPNVTVRVADRHDELSVKKALVGVDRAVLCLTYWERFQTLSEKQQAILVLQACVANGVNNLIFSTFEDTKQLRLKGMKSQIIPDSEGRVHPEFRRMKEVKKMAREQKVQLTHMITSFLDEEISKKSLCLIVGENGK
eukprot:CAMPEP_0194248598 /NCGR_PEP_ID=MMETSP0158-20130606/18708_1 /TAXON_ID=33649 /ORGANISM="Thalassionema nitzschioides, Strain L26-B" /LENGTH=235 /DNA_ID=CAMNT_0038984939 /DNA_START=87 /DNA_END=791 /DNA_ORIENTATION=+